MKVVDFAEGNFSRREREGLGWKKVKKGLMRWGVE